MAVSRPLAGEEGREGGGGRESGVDIIVINNIYIYIYQ
jgi:hypothetical protein